MNNPVYTSVCHGSQGLLLAVRPPPRVVQPPTRVTLPAAAVVEAIVIVPSPVRADLYALLQCGDDSEYGHKTYSGYIKVF
jgi:hypothetical protein